jgi:hypothetical protein
MHNDISALLSDVKNSCLAVYAASCVSISDHSYDVSHCTVTLLSFTDTIDV